MFFCCCSKKLLKAIAAELCKIRTASERSADADERIATALEKIADNTDPSKIVGLTAEEAKP